VIGLKAVLQLWLVLAQLCVLKTTDINRRLNLLIVIKSDLDVVHHDVNDRFKNAVPQIILLDRELLELCLNSLKLSVALLYKLDHPDAFKVLPLLLLKRCLLDIFELLLEHLDKLLDVFVVELHILVGDVALPLVDNHLVLEKGLLKGF